MRYRQMLTDTAIRNAKPKDKPYKMADSGGLYLLVKSAGKYWRMHYRYADKRKTLAIGVYPTVNLLSARKKRDEARDLLISAYPKTLKPNKEQKVAPDFKNEDF